MLNKEHNTLFSASQKRRREGKQKTVNIKAYLNLGFSNDLKKAFPKATPSAEQ